MPNKWKPFKTIIKQENASIIEINKISLAFLDTFFISGSKDPLKNKDWTPIRANHAEFDPFMNLKNLLVKKFHIKNLKFKILKIEINLLFDGKLTSAWAKSNYFFVII